MTMTTLHPDHPALHTVRAGDEPREQPEPDRSIVPLSEAPPAIRAACLCRSTYAAIHEAHRRGYRYDVELDTLSPKLRALADSYRTEVDPGAAVTARRIRDRRAARRDEDVANRTRQILEEQERDRLRKAQAKAAKEVDAIAAAADAELFSQEMHKRTGGSA